MLASILVASVLAAGPMKIRVEVKEYITQKPVEGAQVALREQTGSGPTPLELRGSTDAKGRAWVDVPHLGFAPVDVTKDGYVSRAELQPFRGDFKVMERREPRGSEELWWVVWLIPRSWWQENMKAVTREQAVAIASDWGRECGPGGPRNVAYSEKEVSWFVDFPCMQVLVKPMSGNAIIRVQKPVTATPLYPPEDALADALSGPLEFIGIWPQPGGHEIPECAYRNQKVLVINRYCTIKEINATGFHIIHPDRGVAYFYAEAKRPISTIGREEYEQWAFESHDSYPGARLNMTFDELRTHEARRLKLTDQGCDASFGQTGDIHAGCYHKAPEIEQWWASIYKPILKTPPESWHRLVKVMRRLAVKQGRPDPRGSDSPEEEAAAPAKTPPAPPGVAVGAGPARIVVEVVEYYTRKPVVGARVVLRELNGTQELTAKTGAGGKAWFNAPNVNFTPVAVEQEGLVPSDELMPVWNLFQTLDPTRRAHGDDEVAWEIPVVRRSWLDANMKARTREQAMAIAADWGAECGPGGPTRVELQGGMWDLTYPCMIVRVDPWTGRPGGRKLQEEITSTPLYPPEEALADALSGPLKHVGTTVWYGRYAIPSCVYRNEKVFVVYEYCTIKEMNPTGVKVLHPDRGVVRFRAEGDRDLPVSTLRRDEYAQWSFSTSDPYPNLDLNMGAKALLAWEERRLRFYTTPGCGASLGGSAGKLGRCNHKTPDVERWWDGVYPSLLQTPPERWYELVKVLRKRALKDGRPDPRLSPGK